MRGAIGQEFSGELKRNEKIAEDYYDCRNDTNGARQAKAIVRQDWAQRKYEETKKGQVHTESYQCVNVKAGKYLTFRRIWGKEGLGEEGFAGALKYATKCAAMGPPWIWKDPMSELRKFLHFEHGVEETDKTETRKKRRQDYTRKKRKRERRQTKLKTRQ